ncbi:hypothetical protein DWB61_17235 [Ancylomarina euxinus]|uniref:Uncharacterized protein n=1 Tax=Ancylomarina euxinus TaxID=2283627 RepID=A0A425XWL7_9BACT|nr:hypothetical protein [Ancylomarina euxinus]MCZ4696398.1 hypothetical protein [Ancylomarina euxinus]RRG19024.1 hypothetical protein DWB61_17235 [Ancylomarina euxinus]
MKNIILSIIFIFIVADVFSTEQLSDKLIIDGDTVYLKTFPLEELKIEKSPFKYGKSNFPHTACWRGYCATWKIIEGKLALIDVVKVDSTKKHLDIINYLKLNNYSPKLIEGFVYADWYTKDLTLYHFNRNQWRYGGIYLDKKYSFVEYKEETQLKFRKGVLLEQNIRRMDSYSIGDTLSLKLRIFPPGLVKNKYLKIDGQITENNGQLVKLDIFSFGSKKKKKIKRIKSFLRSKIDSDDIWVNPNYCE